MSGGAAGPVPNITRRGRARRAAAGVCAGALAAGLFVALDGRFDDRWWRLALVPLIAFAALCLFQAQEST